MAEYKQVKKQSGETSQQAITQKKAPERSGPVLQDNRQSAPSPIQRKPNRTGLPDNLKSGMENVSGMSLDHVKVHYNSPKPATVQAHAYAQGNDIHLASGQEKHLPHELGHVVQQMQGKVQATTTVGGMAVNDNPGLEKEADSMGEQALQLKQGVNAEYPNTTVNISNTAARSFDITQMKMDKNYKTTINHTFAQYQGNITDVYNGPKEIVGLTMKAKLNPYQPVRGSATDKVNTDMYAALWKSNGIVRGHLLNHDLGGYGIPANLFPITSGANSRHSNLVEQPIKKKLREGHQPDPNNGFGIWYNVDVMANSTNSGFRCNWGTFEVDKGKEVQITAEPTVPIKSEFTPKVKTDPYRFGGSEKSLDAWHHGNRRGHEGEFNNDVWQNPNNVNAEVNLTPHATPLVKQPGDDQVGPDQGNSGYEINDLIIYSKITAFARENDISVESVMEYLRTGTLNPADFLPKPKKPSTGRGGVLVSAGVKRHGYNTRSKRIKSHQAALPKKKLTREKMLTMLEDPSVRAKLASIGRNLDNMARALRALHREMNKREQEE